MKNKKFKVGTILYNIWTPSMIVEVVRHRNEEVVCLYFANEPDDSVKFCIIYGPDRSMIYAKSYIDSNWKIVPWWEGLYENKSGRCVRPKEANANNLPDTYGS